MPTILEITLPVPLDSHFDYLLGDNSVPEVGQRVLVSFGTGKRARELIGIVLAIKSASKYELEKLKPIKSLLDTQSFIDSQLLSFYQFAARYYGQPLGMVIKSALPSLIRQESVVAVSQSTLYKITSVGKEALITGKIPSRATKQLALLNLLQNQQSSEVLRNAGFIKADLTKSLEKGYITSSQHSLYYETDAISPPLYALNNEQSHVIGKILTHFRKYRASLIFGVTGSGKTEVYMRLIESVLNNKQQVLLLVPEISLTPQMLSRFHRRFGRRVATLHSGRNDRQRKDIWLSAQQGDLQILIGTRSAIFTPFKSLGLILVDEEHDASYKQQEGFRYHARDLAMVRAHSLNIPIVLGSATPSLESLHNVNLGKVTQLNMLNRATETTLPKVKLIDMRGEDIQGVVSPALINQLRSVLSRGEQAMLFLNRRGFAPVMLCTNCSWSSECYNCSTHQTAHVNRRKLICHHCGNENDLPLRCPSCQQQDLQFAGAGTEKLEQCLNEQFPKHQILRLDRDKQTTTKQLEAALSRIQASEVDIVLGTQLIVKGHHFPNMTFVCAVDSDGALYSADFRAEERLLQQLIQVAGRAGRESNHGEVFIQTAVPTHDIFPAIINHDYLSYAHELLTLRKAHAMPPYKVMTEIRASAIDRNELHAYLSTFKQSLTKITEEELEILGPADCAMVRRKNKFNAQLVILADNKQMMQKYLPTLVKLKQHLDKANRYRTDIDIDA